MAEPAKELSASRSVYRSALNEDAALDESELLVHDDDETFDDDDYAAELDPYVSIREVPGPIVFMLVLLLVPSEVSMNVGSVLLPVYRIGLLLLAPFAAFRYLLGSAPRSRLADGGILLSSIWVGVSLANHYDLGLVIEPVGLWWVEALVPYLAARAWLTNSRTVTATLRLIAMIVFPLGLIGIVGSILHVDPVDSIVLPMLGRSQTQYGDRLGMQRVSLMFLHPIHWGVFAAVTFTATRTLFRGAMNKLLRSFACLCAIVSSLSSGALAALMIQIGLISWNRLFASNRHRWLILLCALAFIYVLIDLVSTRDPMRVAFTYLTFSSHTAYWRMIIWEYGSAEVFRHPLFGIGFEEWERPSYMYSGSMDNFWLVIAVRHGIPAFLGFCLIAAVPVIKGFRKMAREGRAPTMEAYMFALSGLVVSACTVHYWLALLVFFTFFCGMAPGCLNDEPQWEEPAYDD
jgi:hypothetical protein